MSQHFDICGIGNAVTDYNIEVNDNFLHLHNIPKGAMQLVEQRTIETILNHHNTNSQIVTAGGSVANSTVAIASLKANAHFIGLCGNDDAGTAFIADIKHHNVHYSLKKTHNTPTSQCVVAVTPDTQRSMCVYLGASLQLSLTHIDTNLIEKSAITLIEGYILDTENGPHIIETVSHYVRKANRYLALSLSDPFLVERHKTTIHALIHSQKIDILIGNDAEMASLTQSKKDRFILNTLQSYPCQTIVMTRNIKGSLIIHNKHLYDIATKPVDNPVDSTGAGDYYIAGFLYGMTHGYTIKQSGKLATQCATHIIQHRGTRTHEPLYNFLTL